MKPSLPQGFCERSTYCRHTHIHKVVRIIVRLQRPNELLALRPADTVLRCLSSASLSRVCITRVYYNIVPSTSTTQITKMYDELKTRLRSSDMRIALKDHRSCSLYVLSRKLGIIIGELIHLGPCARSCRLSGQTVEQTTKP